MNLLKGLHILTCAPKISGIFVLFSLLDSLMKSDGWLSDMVINQDIVKI